MTMSENWYFSSVFLAFYTIFHQPPPSFNNTQIAEIQDSIGFFTNKSDDECQPLRSGIDYKVTRQRNSLVTAAIMIQSKFLENNSSNGYFEYLVFSHNTNRPSKLNFTIFHDVLQEQI